MVRTVRGISALVPAHLDTQFIESLLTELDKSFEIYGPRET
jgi:hypothetical protein